MFPEGPPLCVFCNRFWGRDEYRLHFIDTDTIPIRERERKREILMKDNLNIDFLRKRA